MKRTEGDSPSFDAVLSELELVVKKLEQEDLPLEDALAAYEQGVRLHRTGFAKLAQAEKRIQELTEQGSEVPLQVEEAE